MRLGKMHCVNRESSSKNGSFNFDRHEVLSLLWKNAQWLDEKIHKKQLKLNDALKQRVYMVQVQNSLCKSILYGLKDEELESRIKELEKTLENCVVIPRHEQNSTREKAKF